MVQFSSTFLCYSTSILFWLSRVGDLYKAVIIGIRFDLKQERQGYSHHRYHVMYKIFAQEL